MDELVKIVERDQALIFEFLKSEIDMFNVADINTYFGGAIANRPRLVVFDMKRVSFMDSSAIGFLYNFHKNVSEYGGKFCLANVHEKILQIMEINGAMHYLRCFDTIEEAIRGG